MSEFGDGNMTFLALQRRVADEVREILKDVHVKNAAGAELCGVSVYEQNLPWVEPEQPPKTYQDPFYPEYADTEDDPDTAPEDDPEYADAQDDPDTAQTAPKGYSSFYPHAIVRLMEGKEDEAPDGGWDVEAVILLGAVDPDLDNSGYRAVVEMIQRIVNRFAADPLLPPFWIAKPGTLEWEIQEDEDSKGYPLFLGGVLIHFECPKIDRRWPC